MQNVGKYCGGEKKLSPPVVSTLRGERPRRPRRSDASGQLSTWRRPHFLLPARARAAPLLLLGAQCSGH